jgi:hypothetical protein
MSAKILVFCLFCFSSCVGGKNSNIGSEKPIENTIDYIIENKNNIKFEFPSIYDSLARQIPQDDQESLILSEILKKKGFKEVYWGRGNFPPLGPRIITMALQKGDCICEVSKIYYYTIDDSLYEVSERINCEDSSSYYKQNKRQK